MLVLILGLALFLATHVFAAIRPREEEAGAFYGSGAYRALFSAASLTGLGLIIYGFAAARPAQVLYQPPAVMAHLNMGLMAVAMIVLVSTYLPAGYIKRAAKHPMILSVKIWAVGHLLANGELNSVLLFGTFLVYGVLARIAAKRRGDEGAGAAANVSAVNDLIAVGAGLAVYALIAFYLHPILFGVPVIAPSV